MVARVAVAAAAVVAAVHSFTPVLADTTITAAPSKRTPSHHDLGKRQTTYETASPLPLTDYIYPYSAIPYQVNPYPVLRGPQTGYNQCNGTTEGDKSMCQTAIVNDISDFCIWGSPTPNNTIGEIEAQVVAYCSKAGHGTRIIGGGALQGVQFMKTSAYIQVVGWIDNSGLGLQSDDYGGELDPHGADLLGNPLGGLMYSGNLPKSSQGSTLVPVNSWNNFVGSGQFCMKICDPSITSPNYCENRYDLLGCAYNMPADYASINGTFTSCEGELQDVVGTYVSNGQTMTWSQPASLDPSTTLPWQPRVPASSNCQTYTSASLYSNANVAVPGASTAAGSQTTMSGASKMTGTPSSKTTVNGASNPTTTSGASPIVASSGLFAALLAVVMML